MTRIQNFSVLALLVLSLPAVAMPPGTWTDAASIDAVDAWTKDVGNKISRQPGYDKIRKDLGTHRILCGFSVTKDGRLINLRKFADPHQPELNSIYPSKLIQLATPFKQPPRQVFGKLVIVEFADSEHPNIHLESSTTWNPFKRRWP